MERSMTDEVPPPTQGFDLEAHRRLAVEKYQQVRPLYAAFAEVMHSILKQSLTSAGLKVASIEWRAKDLESYGDKASQPPPNDPEKPKYSDPLREITDLAGVRIITFFPRTIGQVDSVVCQQFKVLEVSDKGDLLRQEERFGYQSVHYLVSLNPQSTSLPEYSRSQNLIAEVQVRTILQHAWAEIEHDLQYKSVETIPSGVRRRFMSLAGLLEIADREFQAVQDEDERLRQAARTSIREGRLEGVEITADALKAYLNKKLGPDGRMSPDSYEWVARMLRRMGFTNFRQIDECIANYDDDALSRQQM
jgi:putative GTP pyrophosphokinase